MIWRSLNKLKADTLSCVIMQQQLQNVSCVELATQLRVAAETSLVVQSTTCTFALAGIHVAKKKSIRKRKRKNIASELDR